MSRMDETGSEQPPEPISREKQPTALKGAVFIIGVLLATTLLVLVALTQRSAEGPFVPDTQPTALPVTVVPATLGETLVLNESFSGLVVARRTSRLGFSAGGRVTKIDVDVGDRVRAGQPLGYLDTRDLRAQLAAAEASIVEARANHELDQAVVERQNKLFARGHVAQQRVDEANARAAAAAARIEAALARAQALQVAIDLAVVHAPFDGVVTERMIDDGVIALPGAAMLELVENGKLEARIGLPTANAASLSIDQEVELISERGPVAAKVRSSTGVVDRTQRTVMVIFDVLTPKATDPGAIVRLSIDRSIEERGFWVPIAALTESSRGLWSVYVASKVDGQWRATPQFVEIVRTEGTRAYARGTVRDGDRIIVDGLARLVPGQLVRFDGHAPTAAIISDGEG